MSAGKKLLTNSVVYVLLGFLAPAINFILLPIYTKHLEVEDYAIITQSALIQSFLATILGLGINAAFSRFYFDYYKNEEEIHTLYSTTITSFIGTGLIAVLILSLSGQFLLNIIFKNDVFTFWKYGIYTIIIAWFFNFQQIILLYYRNREDALRYAFLSIFFFLSVAGSIYIGVVPMDLKAEGSITGRSIGATIPVLLYLVWYYRNKKIKFSSLLNKQMLVYGLPMIPYLFLNSLMAQIDKFAVERFFDLRLLGLYGFGFLISSVNDIFINAVNSAISPQIFKTLKEENPNQDKKVNALIQIYVGIALWVNVGIVVVGTPGIIYFTNVKYAEVADIFPLLCLAFIPRIFYTSYFFPIFYHGKTKVLPIINLITFIIGGLVLLGLAPLWGLYGVCIGRIVLQLAQMIAAKVYVDKQSLMSKAQMKMPVPYYLTLFTTLYIAIWYYFLFQGTIPYIHFYLFPLFIIVSIGLFFSNRDNIKSILS